MSALAPNPTERRQLGSTAVRVTRLGLGCAPIGNLYSAVDEHEALATVDAALDAGLRFFDTAPLYGHGRSESRLGRALATSPVARPDVTVATKVGRLLVPGATSPTIFADAPDVEPVFDFSSDGVLRSFEASLLRLGLDRVDIVHVHDPDDFVDDALRNAFPALRRLRDEGLIGAIGAGMNQSAALTRFVQEAGVDCVLVAGRYTLLDQGALTDLLPACAEAGVSVIAAGVFNSGILASPGEGATFDYATAPDELVARALRIDEVCRRHGVSAIAAALQFPLGHPAVTSVLVGARSRFEVEANVAAFATPVPAAVWDELRSSGLLAEWVPVPG